MSQNELIHAYQYVGFIFRTVRTAFPNDAGSELNVRAIVGRWLKGANDHAGRNRDVVSTVLFISTKKEKLQLRAVYFVSFIIHCINDVHISSSFVTFSFDIDSMPIKLLFSQCII